MHTFSYFIMHVWPVVEKEKKNENPFTFWGEMKMTKILSLFCPPHLVAHRLNTMIFGISSV